MLALVKSLTIVEEDEGDEDSYPTTEKENQVHDSKITPTSVPKIPLPPPIPTTIPQPLPDTPTPSAVPIKPAFVFVTEEDEMREKEELKKKSERSVSGKVRSWI